MPTKAEVVAERVKARETQEARVAGLEALAARLGLEITNVDTDCLRRLVVRQHRCNSMKCYREEHENGHRAPDRVNFDHLRWLREPGGGRWVLLTQPYSYDAELLDEFCAKHGCRWELLDGEAPHGCGTHAIIIVGA